MLDTVHKSLILSNCFNSHKLFVISGAWTKIKYGFRIMFWSFVTQPCDHSPRWRTYEQWIGNYTKIVAMFSLGTLKKYAAHDCLICGTRSGAGSALAFACCQERDYLAPLSCWWDLQHFSIRNAGFPKIIRSSFTSIREKNIVWTLGLDVRKTKRQQVWFWGSEDVVIWFIAFEAVQFGACHLCALNVIDKCSLVWTIFFRNVLTGTCQSTALSDLYVRLDV